VAVSHFNRIRFSSQEHHTNILEHFHSYSTLLTSEILLQFDIFIRVKMFFTSGKSKY